MDGCLACKSCVGQCPIKVDVPNFRAKFLELDHGRYLRPARHYFVGALEHVVPLLAIAPGLHNALVGSRIGRAGLRSVGLVHSPALSSKDLRSGLGARGISVASPAILEALTPAERAKSLVVVQDAFTSHCEAGLLLDLFDFLVLLGIRPWIAPYRPNGKPLHVHGFLGAFRRVAARNAAMLARLAATGVELVGVDPSMTLSLPVRIRDRAGAGCAASCHADPGVACAAPRSGSGVGPRARICSAATLHRAHERAGEPAPMAGNFCRTRRDAARPSLRLLRHGRKCTAMNASTAQRPSGSMR